MKILFLFLFLTSIAFSQKEFKVELRDSQTNEPISFATIRFKGTNRGLIADYNGQFRLPNNNYQTSILLITSLGHAPLELDVKILNPNIINIIKMSPSVETLDTVILKFSKRNQVRGGKIREILKENKSMLAYEIVYRAINSIKSNLDSNPHSYVGYYRDYQIMDGDYFNLNEGILEQFDSGIQSHKITDSLNQAAIYSFKQNTDFKTNKQLTKTYNDRTKFIPSANILGFGGNELSILNVHNPIRNYKNKTFSFVYQFNLDFLNLHKFRKGKITFKNDEPLIEIMFSNKKKQTSLNHDITGNLKISLLDYSIHSFNYAVFDYNNVNPLFNVNIEYRKQNENMYLNYITFNNKFIISDEDVFKESKIIYNKKKNNFEVTFNGDLDLKTVKRRNFKIRFKKRKIFIKSIEVKGPRTVILHIAQFDKLLENIQEEEISQLQFYIKGIDDAKGRTIYVPEKIAGYQFREFFVQEIFENQMLKSSLKYVDKVKPLIDSYKNKIIDMKTYIINSPLMKRRIE